MRYILYLFTLALVFTSGMMVGNLYLPDRSASLAAAVSVPDVNRLNPAMDAATAEQAQANLNALTQALTACPVVVEEEKQRLLNQITLFLALQDFNLKKSTYEAEIAKNTAGNRPTAQFSKAAAEYSLAKTHTEQLAEELFPPQISETSDDAANTPAAASSDTIKQ